VAKLRADLATIDAALTAADKAYTDNQSSELAAAMSKYSRPASQLGADVAALAATMKAQCDATVTGP
jgi:phage-related minor tail protein